MVCLQVGSVQASAGTCATTRQSFSFVRDFLGVIGASANHFLVFDFFARDDFQGEALYAFSRKLRLNSCNKFLTRVFGVGRRRKQQQTWQQNGFFHGKALVIVRYVTLHFALHELNVA